ncbi:hypothetical protein RJT34_16040 [Clitoria ternatea]|uniref:Uncharacterized protein n=1 Tax=Clitoria ternatea TaxID=43366 RepID=A0AAN9PBZ6_CLITE
MEEKVEVSYGYRLRKKWWLGTAKRERKYELVFLASKRRKNGMKNWNVELNIYREKGHEYERKYGGGEGRDGTTKREENDVQWMSLPPRDTSWEDWEDLSNVITLRTRWFSHRVKIASKWKMAWKVHLRTHQDEYGLKSRHTGR